MSAPLNLIVGALDLVMRDLRRLDELDHDEIVRLRDRLYGLANNPELGDFVPHGVRSLADQVDQHLHGTAILDGPKEARSLACLTEGVRSMIQMESVYVALAAR